WPLPPWGSTWPGPLPAAASASVFWPGRPGSRLCSERTRRKRFNLWRIRPTGSVPRPALVRWWDVVDRNLNRGACLWERIHRLSAGVVVLDRPLPGLQLVAAVEGAQTEPLQFLKKWHSEMIRRYAARANSGRSSSARKLSDSSRCLRAPPAV